MHTTVDTEAGQVEGIPARDRSITVFRGIPYAAPPVGELRWRAPQPPAPWPGVDFSKYGPVERVARDQRRVRTGMKIRSLAAQRDEIARQPQNRTGIGALIRNVR